MRNRLNDDDCDNDDDDGSVDDNDDTGNDGDGDDGDDGDDDGDEDALDLWRAAVRAGKPPAVTGRVQTALAFTFW